MRLRKYLNLCYEQGWVDGVGCRPPDWVPGPPVALFGSSKPYDRWAYNAGHRDGRSEHARLAAVVKRIIEETAA